MTASDAGEFRMQVQRRYPEQAELNDDDLLLWEDQETVIVESGTTVSAEACEEALVIFAMLERAFRGLVDREIRGGNPEPDEDACLQRLEAMRKPELDHAKAVIRAFGEAIEPRTLEQMQRVLSRMLEDQFGDDDIAHGAAKTAVEQAWDGVGPWQA